MNTTTETIMEITAETTVNTTTETITENTAEITENITAEIMETTTENKTFYYIKPKGFYSHDDKMGYQFNCGKNMQIP